MQFYYGEKNLIRALDEAEFWKQQEKEHTVVIRTIVPDLEKQYVDQLEKWGHEFAKTHSDIVKFIETLNRSKFVMSPLIQQQIRTLIKFCATQSEEFTKFLNIIYSQSEAIRNNMIAKTVIDHIIRESKYFIGIVQIALNMPI